MTLEALHRRAAGFFDRVPVSHAAFTAITCAYFVKIELATGIDRPPAGVLGALQYAMSLGAINALVLGVRWALRRRDAARRATLTFLFFFQWCGGSYHLRQRSPADFATLFANANDLSWDALLVAVNYLSPTGLAWATVGTLVYGFLSRRFDRAPDPPRAWWFAALAVAYGSVMIAPSTPYGSLTFLARSTLHHHFAPPLFDVVIAPDEAPYIAVQRSGRTALPHRPQTPPHIFLILVESLNANFVETRTPGGQVHTPVMNALIERGLYLERFYANSIQTCRGHAAAFLSVLPSFNHKLSISFANNAWYGAPQLLYDHGYQTVFFQAHEDLDYDNGQEFYHRVGFANVHSAAEFPMETDEEEHWGWGLSDRAFYRTFFANLESLRGERPDAPILAALAPISNHVPFSRMPDEEKKLYGVTEDHAENYANSVHAADAAIRVFFEELERRPELDNSVVIVTGDHSFPANEHGLAYNQVSYYEEFFRTPFILVWPGVIEPERRATGNYAQVDIAPTLADLAGIETYRHHYLGASVLDPSTGQGPVHLIQPYNGRYFGVVDGDLKFVRHIRSGAEHLFDLSVDPDERDDLEGDDAHQADQDRLRESLRAIYLNQRLVELDQIWVPER